MATIYGDKPCDLHELLGWAYNDQGATLLIPDLQRPYVWSPSQVIWLVDSLIRGWPFGTFLIWNVGKDDPVRELARSFWQVVDRTDAAETEQITKSNPPGKFMMVLDGQQRIQSLLLAFCGDSWGFRLYDSDWRVALNDEKPRSRQNSKHWSLGCLCLNLTKLLAHYKKSKSVAAIDFTNVLEWAITGGTEAQSERDKKSGASSPLSLASENKGKFIRMSRMWKAAPTVDNVEPERADELAQKVLDAHDVEEGLKSELVRPLGSLLMALARVKKTRVTYLELKEYDENVVSRENYNDAVVNIFTRLNTGGRTLTREDITFAWLKVGWDPKKTGNTGAAECFDALESELVAQNLGIITEDLISGVSFVWSSVYADGKLLSNNDLLKGDAIRPMAKQLSENWSTLTTAIIAATTAIADRKLTYHQHFQSLNSVVFLWTWRYIAELWLSNHPLRTLDHDAAQKRIAAVFNKYADRWLLCSQWAGTWAVASAERIAAFSKKLNDCAKNLAKAVSPDEMIVLLETLLETEVRALEAPANATIQTLQASRREMVRTYYSPLWIWHRIDTERWKQSKIQLRVGKKRLKHEVDHAVAHALWQEKVEAAIKEEDKELRAELISVINRLGNCSLLEKSFNIVKGKLPLTHFLKDVHDFKANPALLTDWSSKMGFTDCMLDPSTASIDDIKSAIETRDTQIRQELVEFVTGKRSRVDIEET